MSVQNDFIPNLITALFAQKLSLQLPYQMREQMRTPLGTVFTNEFKTLEHIHATRPFMVLTVGDVVTATLLKAGFTPDISIIDFKTRRDSFFSKENSGETISNLPGQISREAVTVLGTHIETFIKTGLQSTLYIEGEEDLLALPAILLAPENSAVLYGQFNLGVVYTTVTREKKTVVKNILSQFD